MKQRFGVVMNYEDGKQKGFPQVVIRLVAPQHFTQQRDGGSKPDEEAGELRDLVVIRYDGTNYLGLDHRNWMYLFSAEDVYERENVSLDILYAAFYAYAQTFKANNGVHELMLYVDGSGRCACVAQEEHYPVTWAYTAQGVFKLQAMAFFHNNPPE